MDINEWSAKECGINYFVYGDSVYYGDDDCVSMLNKEFVSILDIADICRSSLMEWDVKDPRCREIVREKLFLSTEYMDGFVCSTPDPYSCFIVGQGKSIEEAELAVLKAIYEARGL